MKTNAVYAIGAVLLAASIMAGTVLAEPKTLHKANNIAIAKENAARHQWAKDIVEGWKRSTAAAMEKDRAFFEDMLDPVTPWPLYGQNCPACVGRLSTMGETNLYKWNVNEPDKLTCKYCGTVYPNDAYPETGKLECPAMKQTFTFYLTEEERAHSDDTSGKYTYRWASWPVHTSFSGVLRAHRGGWCIAQILPLAKLYALTGDTRYAGKAAEIMDVVASRYSGWLYHSYNGTYADCPPGEAASEMGAHPPAGRFPETVIRTAFPGLHSRDGYATLNNGFWGAGRFGCSGSDGGLILDMAVAYDLIHEAVKPDGSPVITPAMRERIVDDLILPGAADSENWNEINNKCGPGRAMSGAVGILFDRPESVHRAVTGFETLMEHSFHFDGFCKESPSYSAMHLNLLREIPEVVAGYSDPPGWRNANGWRMDAYDPFKADIYRLSLESMVRMLDFNNKFPVIGDTHFGSGIDPIYAEVLVAHYGEGYAGLLEQSQGAPLAEKGSEYALWNRPPGISSGGAPALTGKTEWFPGWHVGMLRGGGRKDSTLFCFNGYEHGTHRHYDTLGIAYDAFGKELVSDRGYIWDDPRNAWTKSTLCHNIVEVDGVNQNIEECRSKLELFGVSPLVEVVEASANAYTQCDRYARTCALVMLPDGGSYAVDFFRVRGGKLHRYSFNNNGSLKSVRGADLSPVTADDMKWLANLRAAKPEGSFSATWEYEDISTDMIMLNPVSRLIVADAPGWRNNRGEALNSPPIQQIIAERTSPAGKEGAESVFAVVMVPYRDGVSPVKAVRALSFDFASGACGIAVELEGRTDYIVSSPDAAKRKYGKLTVAGRFAFASVDGNGSLTGAYLLGGTTLSYGRAELSLKNADITMNVASREGRTYRLASPVPAAIDLTGKYVLAGDTGYEITSWTADSITMRDYPTVECGTLRILDSGIYHKK